MENNSKIPEGWSMPDDLAKQVSEELNKKSITPQDAILDALGELVASGAKYKKQIARLAALRLEFERWTPVSVILITRAIFSSDPTSG